MRQFHGAEATRAHMSRAVFTNPTAVAVLGEAPALMSDFQLDLHMVESRPLMVPGVGITAPIPLVLYSVRTRYRSRPVWRIA